ncbi:hypothetical protein AYI70_g10847, partial [Smittium culicis]
MNSENSGKKFGFEKSESVRNSTVKLPYVPGKSWEDSESVKSHLTGSDSSLIAEPEIKLSTEPEISLNAEPEISLSAEPEIKLSTEPELKLTADPEIKPTVYPEISQKMDLPKNLSIELILDSDDEASSLSQKKNDEGDIENSSVKPPRPAFQYSKTIETKNPKEKVKLNLTAALACKTFTP